MRIVFTFYFSLTIQMIRFTPLVLAAKPIPRDERILIPPFLLYIYWQCKQPVLDEVFYHDELCHYSHHNVVVDELE